MYLKTYPVPLYWLYDVLLLIGANERQGKDEPPGTSDDKRQTRCQHGGVLNF